MGIDIRKRTDHFYHNNKKDQKNCSDGPFGVLICDIDLENNENDICTFWLIDARVYA